MIRRLIVLTVAATALSMGQAAAQGAFPAPLPGQTGTVNDPAFPPVNGAPAKRAASDSPFPPVNGAPALRPSTPPDSAFPPVNGAPAARVGASPAAFPSGGAAPIAGGGGGFAAPPPPGGGAGGPSDACMKNFVPLREEAEKRGKAIKTASDKHASAAEACKLIGNYGKAELNMIKYVEANAAKCGIPPQIADQLKAGHKNTEGLLKRVCGAAEQQAQAQSRGPAGPSLSDVLGSSASLPEATPTKKGGSTFDTLNGNVLTR
ncbi:hypothetical protein [Bradyrhizobium ivorense]|uniref:hypothetical protein n=1 Tax=Bradyrhizobium ivorense TaxID=2511166 RepID=UPI0010BBC6D6|nr:hypothetical protein [Bradyrhizobium ivorense]VIO68242.1 hypothetical protein CI41S_13670 [Bradyrhizobium ivorense]